MVTTLLIPADIDRPIEIADMASLADYQKAVGGYIEAIGARPPAVTFIVNEEGKLRELPLNTRATVLWWYIEERFVNTDSLRGDVVLAGPSGAHYVERLDRPDPQGLVGPCISK